MAMSSADSSSSKTIGVWNLVATGSQIVNVELSRGVSLSNGREISKEDTETITNTFSYSSGSKTSSFNSDSTKTV
jgi:hypothetical protein